MCHVYPAPVGPANFPDPSRKRAPVGPADFPVPAVESGPPPAPRSSAELLTVSQISDRSRNTPKSAQNRSESLCAGLWVPSRTFWAWFVPALGRNPARNRRFPAGSLKVVGALVAQPRIAQAAIWDRILVRSHLLLRMPGPAALLSNLRVHWRAFRAVTCAMYIRPP